MLSRNQPGQVRSRRRHWSDELIVTPRRPFSVHAKNEAELDTIGHDSFLSSCFYSVSLVTSLTDNSYLLSLFWVPDLVLEFLLVLFCLFV